jgi:hypothetical protein
VLACAIPAAAAGDLARKNDAIEAWIAHIDSDQPFLLLDVSAGELRLQHGSALLRTCKLEALQINDAVSVTQRLQSHVRRYSAEPFQSITTGPFDWEQYLVQEANDNGLLQFTGGLLVHADPLLSYPRAARIAATDLRALFDAVNDSTGLVLLPIGWDRMDSESRQ